MWRTTTKKLLLATFWFGVAFAALLAKTKEPYEIVLASMALSFAAINLFDHRWVGCSERGTVVLMAAMQVALLVIVGLAFAMMGR